LTRAALTVSLATLLLFGSLNASAQPAPGASPPAAAPPSVTTVGANLNISPKRVTFDRNRRSATVYVYNQGNAPGTFDVSLVDRAMLPDGQIVALADSANNAAAKPFTDRVKSAQPIMQISPRRVVLNPGQGQTIRLRLSNLPAEGAGEYRSHLTVTTIPPASAGITAEAAAGLAPNELRFQINSVFGLSIPAIVRVGDIDVRAAIQNARVEYVEMSADGQSAPRRTPVMAFELVRQGGNSLFGNIEVRPSGQRRGEPVGIARGVGVYPEIDRRTVRVPLTRAPASGEQLEITFTDDDTSPGKVLARQVL